MSKISEYIKRKRKEPVMRDKVNRALAMFGMEAVPERVEHDESLA